MGNCLVCRRAIAANDGSVLDRVISQASNEDDCLLYRLANYKNGGELIDAYNVGGQVEVEKLIREQFGVLMYNDGKGQVIKRAEYLRWKFRDVKQVVLPIEASLSPHDPLAKWEDHEACWQMQYRGSLGETLLHVLIICDTKLHTRLARTLLKCFPKLAMDVVEGEEYLGASALHLSIAYANNELVQDLVDAGANVMQRAIGSFFLPRDQQLTRPKKYTDYEGLAYLGEYPLAWAACCANESVYNLLCDSGANPDAQDSFGNMILHMVVVCDKLDMFGYALRHPRLPAKNGIVNKAGLTPLTLACKLGRAEVFREMLELSCREFWRYSNITCSAYPLNALDTLLPDGRTNWNSALFIILNGTKEEHLDMLDGGIIQRLLEEKWKTFARHQFLKRLAILALHLLTLSMAVYLRPERAASSGDQWDASAVLRAGFEVGTLCNILSYLFLQQGGEIKNQGLMSFLKQLGNAPAKAIFLLSNILILLCIPFRLSGDVKTEEAILLFAVPGSWFLLMFFAGAVRLTGPFVTMVYSMITGDMLTFGIIYTVVLFGFSQSFYFLYKGFPGVKNTQYATYPSTWMALFQITLGDYSYPDLANTTYPSLSKSVFAIFMVLVPILLLNMLIAMMGNTYAHVIEQSEKEWMKQWAKIVVNLERAVNQEDAHHYLQEYSMSLGPSDDPATEQRGVLVIKSKSKTRAKQRKGAVSNWKRVGKVTINELRKRGMSGEQLRRIMWGRASISTPVKAKKAKTGYDLTALMDMGAIETPLVVDTPAVNATADPGQGFGAFTSALDMMAFTNDIGVPASAAPGSSPGTGPPTANPQTIQQGAPPAQAQGGKPAVVMNGVPPQMNPGGPVVVRHTSATGTGPQAQGLQGPPPPPLSEQAVPTTPPPPYPGPGPGPGLTPCSSQVPFPDDPLRELVLVASQPRAKVTPEQLAALARRAAENDHLELVGPEDMGLFYGFAVPAKTRNRKQSVTLDPSDSDDFGEGPLLGRVARLRRARSAVSRPGADPGGLQLHGRHGLHGPHGPHHMDDGFSSSTASSFDAGMSSPPFVMPPLAPQPAAQLAKPPAPAQPAVSSSQPVQPRQQPQPTPATNGTTGGNGKKHRHKRPKTAKPNRVAPTPDAPPRRGMSAGHTNSQMGSGSGSGSADSQDPLEPWSVRGIEPMNALLAWDQEEHDSL